MTGLRSTIAGAPSEMLVRYTPGDDLDLATFSRGSAATYANANTFNAAVSELLARYAPGDRLNAAVASRSTTATYSGLA